MCEELRKLMEPEFSEAKKIAEEEGRRAGMEAGRKLGIEAGRKLGIEDGRREGRREGVDLSISIINKLQAGKSLKEIEEETGAGMEMIVMLQKTLGLK